MLYVLPIRSISDDNSNKKRAYTIVGNQMLQRKLTEIILLFNLELAENRVNDSICCCVVGRDLVKVTLCSAGQSCSKLDFSLLN